MDKNESYNKDLMKWGKRASQVLRKDKMIKYYWGKKQLFFGTVKTSMCTHSMFVSFLI